MTTDLFPTTAEALDALYQSTEDPWGTRSIPEKQVRYEELKRFLPEGPHGQALEIACGEGDFSARLMRVAREVTGLDISYVVVERAQSRYPEVRFSQGDVRELPHERLREYDLIVWLDAMYWLPREESAKILKHIADSVGNGTRALLFSARVIPRCRTDMSFWDQHDFETPRQFIEHVRHAFPSARAVPVQLHLDLTMSERLTWAQRGVRFGLKVLNRLGGYRLALRLTQRASTVPFLEPLVEPFIVHVAAIVDPAQSPYPKSVEDVTDRFLNRPVADRIAQKLIPTSVTPNQVTAICCLLGLSAAAILSLGSWPAIILGGLLLQFSIVLDCVDGQLARAKGLTSQWGEVFDHTSDDLIFLFVSFALALTIWQSDLGSLEKLLLTTSSFGVALLLTASQYFYNEEYRTVTARGVTGGVRDDEKRIMMACQEQGPERPGRLGLVLLRYYASRLRTMHRLLTWVNPWRARLLEVQPVDTGRRRTYWEIQALPLWLWRLAGMSSVALLLVLACLLGMPLGFAWLLTLAGFPYSICVLWLQRRADHLTFRAWTE
jgi:phosphatidylglycerophosphate synthase